MQILKLPDKISTSQIIAQIIEFRMNVWMFYFGRQVAPKKNFQFGRRIFSNSVFVQFESEI